MIINLIGTSIIPKAHGNSVLKKWSMNFTPAFFVDSNIWKNIYCSTFKQFAAFDPEENSE